MNSTEEIRDNEQRRKLTAVSVSLPLLVRLKGDVEALN